MNYFLLSLTCINREIIMTVQKIVLQVSLKSHFSPPCNQKCDKFESFFTRENQTKHVIGDQTDGMI